ncbi:methyl-accepting chemotaxis protein [Thermosulfurimonas sp. F29]|uniref:methyl-accepting chemotaxis protein n=1 Tax=Thermosulfurimonas sp. F29 TaxID=2867247 RepID=UPI001C82D457|nr:methyl-accepting chemotaxis protein [Thermosulfurimonas sp. F29]MBX6423571.1 methyl-accepting chemotaxis protein [Thermosulfurimonas sp. F29]
MLRLSHETEQFRTLTEDLERQYLELALTLAAMPEIQRAVAERDREKLLSIAGPLSREINRGRAFPLKIHFHVPPGVSLLRVWKPDKWGDDISGFRKTVVTAQTTGRPVMGIEPGRAGLAVRGVVPIIYKGRVVGSVEVFSSLTAVARSLRKTLKVENALFWIETVKATVMTERVGQHLGRFKILLAAHPEEMRLVSEDLVEKGLSKSFTLEREGRLLLVSPVRDYSGKAVGVYVRFMDLRPLLGRLKKNILRSVIETVLMLILAAGVVVGAIWVGVSRPMRALLEATERVSGGRLDVSVAESGASEMCRLAASLNRMMEAFSSFVREMQKQAGDLSAIAEDTARRAEEVQGGSERVKEEVARMSELTRAASQGMEDISKALDQFAEAVQEVVRGITQTSQGMEEVRGRVQLATEKIGLLDASSQKIGEMVEVIEAIANQTNLLALNATIEAARAGEAGKGFAVVAGEVKELARQTTEATDNIRRTVETIRAEVEAAVGAVRDVEEIVNGVSEQAAHIAGAAEEQTAVLSEIRTNVEAGLERSREVSAAAESARAVAEEFLRIAENIQRSAQELREISTRMKEHAARFRV